MDITPTAMQRVEELLQNELSKHFLRIYIIGGGCSGFQYGFELEELKQLDDLCFSYKGSAHLIQLIIDPISASYMKGAQLDYKKDITGQQFIIHNPLVKTTCGCGLSFSLNI